MGQYLLNRKYGLEGDFSHWVSKFGRNRSAKSESGGEREREQTDWNGLLYF